MATRAEMLAEASRRGLLSPEKQAAYDEAVKRGLVRAPTATEQQPPAPVRELSFLDKVRGGMGLMQRASRASVEPVASMASGAVAAPIAGLSGILGTAVPGDAGQGATVVREVQDALTWDPKGEDAKKVMQGISVPFEKLQRGIQYVSEKGGMGSPLASTAIETGINAVPMAFGIRKPPTSRIAAAQTARNERLALDQIADTPQRKARRVIERALEADNLTPTEAAARLRELGPNARLVDLGENVAGVARAATAKPGPARTAAKDFLEQRQAGQQLRVIKATGLGDVKDFKRNFQSAMRSRHSQASPLYDAAYAQPLDLSTPRMRALLQRPAVKDAMREGMKILKDEGGGSGHVRLMDAAARHLSDRIGAAKRAGERETVRRLTMIRRQLLDEVDAQVPEFGQARGIYAGEAAMRDAAQVGRNMLTRKLDLDDVEFQVRAMGEGELAMFQKGAMRGILDKLDSTAGNRNAAGKLIESTRAREVLRLAFPDEAAFNRLLNAADAESQFARTRQFVRGGSPTSRIDAEKEALERVASIGEAVMTGGKLGAAREVLKAMGFGKVSDKTLRELGRLLFEEYAVPAQPLPRLPAPISAQLPSVAPGAVAAGGVIASQPSTLPPGFYFDQAAGRVKYNQRPKPSSASPAEREKIRSTIGYRSDPIGAGG